MFKGIRTVVVYATDKTRAQEFYTRVLGFEVAHDLGPELAFLRSRNGEVYIYLEGGKAPASADAGACRLSFFLEAEKTAAEAHAELRAAGVRLLQEGPEPVSDADACFQFLDPDGNIIEVSGKL